VISELERWKFAECTLPHDGTGVITRWMDQLDEEVQAEFDARLLIWAAKDKWLDLYGGLVEIEIGADKYGERFEELTKTREITVTVNGVLYRILGVHFDVWEFVMLIGYSDDQCRSEIPSEVQECFLERLNDLRRNRQHRRNYELELE
jgi:hypothetical protein